ncbi:unnamed protein product [Macrosiphum euphorbiae]|uniref:Uncharacterized protein n=1 Tax=Macrosiphum euphorbiae TaxID=13131 RepID=A0AAV0Y5F9_9HEMI|nr:unnamed protein product [Macrosiphum euphorbiae]CAI6372801.1 unnamed protein product [Macrosiphum euphorbiae]CAI6375167.1 unnamed protein product [Macrosiphum euphorbiae]CAI6376159.1 unnamed protein product [Macrosiphum euphorbiae]
MKLAGIEKRKATLKENEDGRKKRRELETLKLTERIRLYSSSSSEDQDTLLEEVLSETPGCSLPMPSSSKPIRAKKSSE